MYNSRHAGEVDLRCAKFIAHPDNGLLSEPVRAKSRTMCMAAVLVTTESQCCIVRCINDAIKPSDRCIYHKPTDRGIVDFTGLVDLPDGNVELATKVREYYDKAVEDLSKTWVDFFLELNKARLSYLTETTAVVMQSRTDELLSHFKQFAVAGVPLWQPSQVAAVPMTS